MAKVSWLCRVALVILSFTPSVVRADDSTQPVRVLFIGNSYTYFNNLPVLLEKLAASAPNARPVKATMFVEGGATLHRLWDQKKAIGLIQKEHWDYVVLQEQSSLGYTYLVDGVTKVTDFSDFHKYARLFDKAIKEAGAKTVFYSTWARKDAAQQDQAMLDYAYITIAKELHALVVPVGIAWQAVRRSDPKVELYYQDGSHPSPIGSYLAACCCLGTMLNQSPVGLTSEISGPAIAMNGTQKGKQDQQLCKLDDSTAKLVQSKAWDACTLVQKAGGYPDIAKPPAPELPTPPEGDAIKPEDLEGHWVGTTKLYPRFFLPQSAAWPAKMELTCKRNSDKWEMELSVTLGANMPKGAQKVSDIVVSDRSLSFVDHQRGLNGGFPTYRAVIKDKKMIGIAEIKSKNSPLFAIGGWELHKE
jgi:hypothetical protein